MGKQGADGHFRQEEKHIQRNTKGKVYVSCRKNSEQFSLVEGVDGHLHLRDPVKEKVEDPSCYIKFELYHAFFDLAYVQNTYNGPGSEWGAENTEFYKMQCPQQACKQWAKEWETLRSETNVQNIVT